MILKFIKPPVYVFIDVENTFYAQNTLRWRISYEKLMGYFKKECGEDIKCFAYSGVDEANVKQKKFLDMIDIVGYITRVKSVKKIKTKDGNIKWKSSLDIEMALEMIELTDKFNTAVLFSGDSDFAVVLDKLKFLNKKSGATKKYSRVLSQL
jgi:uncharacterized LabA/DUF88 family protein